MRKRIISLFMAMLLALSLVACGAEKETQKPADTTEKVEQDTAVTPEITPETTPEITPEVTPEPEQTPAAGGVSALEVFTAAWEHSAKEFPAVGGSFENMVDSAPGSVGLTEKDFMEFNLLIPADLQAKATEVSSLIHMMNGNTFTGVAMKVDGMSVEEVAETMKTAFLGTQFMCGIPDKIIIYAVDDVVLYTYGAAEIIDSFKADVESLANAKVLVDENFM